MTTDTEKYEEMILEVEFDPAVTPAVFTPICGMIDVSIKRTSNVDTMEVPDCDDESKPLSVEREVRSQEVIVTASGVWAKSSNSKLIEWWRSGTTLKVQLRNTKAATGDIEIEAGPALLSQVNNDRTKGKKVSADIQIEFDGIPTTTMKA